MDLNRLMTMVVNRVLGRLINTGISKGIDHVARRGKPQAELTDAERHQVQGARDAAKRARKAAQITRRLGR